MLLGLGIAVAVAAALWRLQIPGHRLLPLFFVLLAAASVAYYLGFVDRGWNPFRFLAQAATLSLLGLALLVGYVSRLDLSGAERIAEFITPCPDIQDVAFLPAVSPDQLQSWLVRSGASAEAVSRFYLREEHRTGWALVTPPPVMVMDRNGQRLTVLIGEHPQGGSQVAYDLRRLAPAERSPIPMPAGD